MLRVKIFLFIKKIKIKNVESKNQESTPSILFIYLFF